MCLAELAGVTYGHVVGDVVLRDIGTIVLNNISKEALFGRWGGEEFVILLQAPLDEAVQLAEKIRYLIQKHQFHSVPSVSASFGIAQYMRNDTIETLTSRADMAMYGAKITGKNRIEVA
jgi:diguanylate cyclase (GGDEF)-like protein